MSSSFEKNQKIKLKAHIVEYHNEVGKLFTLFDNYCKGTLLKLD